MKNYLLIVLTFVLFLPSCYYDNEEFLYPNSGNCDTSNVTYTTTIKPIMQQYCTGCHNSSNPSAGIDLTTYGFCVQYGQNGSLYGSILQNGSYSAMPKNGNKLDECTLNKIQKWINDGYPN